VQNRAYAHSFIEIKAIEEDARIIRGVATTPTPDRVDDIVQPLGAKFTLPLPHLWQHDSHSPIGHVIEAKPQKSGIPFVSQIAKTEEPGPLKDLLDMAWQSMKLRLVRAVSIGFRPLEWAVMSSGGWDILEWDWYELSSVTIPAQPEATITQVKQLDRIYREVAGIPEFDFAELENHTPIPVPPEPDAPVRKVPVVKLGSTARVRAPFLITKIHSERTP
jgi:HK97 family phage prohead protease